MNRTPTTLDLSDARPTIIVDSREQSPLPIRRLPTVRAGLLAGDYGIAGADTLFAVERKSIPDIVSCCAGSNRDRFERELCRLRGYRFKRLLIVGTQGEIAEGRYRSNVRPASVLHSLAAWECRYDVPVAFAPTPHVAARQVAAWASWFARELLRTADALKGRA